MMKQILKRGYRSLEPILPKSVRNEISSYRRFRQQRRKPPAMPAAPAPKPAPKPTHSLAYWERREIPNPAKREVRVGVIGAGQYAQHHLQVLTALENVKVDSILSTGAPRVYQTAATFHIPNIFTDIDAFLKHPVDAFVVVASAQHLKALTLQCLATGKPVLLEKPAGVSPEDTLELVAQAERSRTFGMVCMNRRFYSVLEHGLAVLSNWGPLRGVMLEIPLAITQERQSKRLAAWDYDHFLVRNSIHGIDLVRYVLGDPLHVHSLARPNTQGLNAGASFASILEYDRGVVATITDLWDTPQVWRMKIVAEKGWLEFQPLETGWICRAANNKSPIRMDPLDKEFRMGVYAQDLHFIEAVRHGHKPTLPASLLGDAYKTMRLVEQIETSTVESNRFVPLKDGSLNLGQLALY